MSRSDVRYFGPEQR
jgi:hypothetical protein